MDLQKLYASQMVLRNRINYEGPDRFNKLVLALLVEIGECANEWRGFKFWSKDQEPRTAGKCKNCYGLGKGFFAGKQWDGTKHLCIECHGTGRDDSKNPLIEEYVDGLHVILDLGIELNVNPIDISYGNYGRETINEQFIDLTSRIIDIWDSGQLETRRFYWYGLFMTYVELGAMLGFSWDQIEQAYYDKNKINHQRQENGY